MCTFSETYKSRTKQNIVDIRAYMRGNCLTAFGDISEDV